jgi:hypothetical protein
VRRIGRDDRGALLGRLVLGIVDRHEGDVPGHAFSRRRRARALRLSTVIAGSEATKQSRSPPPFLDCFAFGSQ